MNITAPLSVCIIDDDQIFIKTSKILIESVFGSYTNVNAFSDPYEGVEHLKNQKDEVLLLDIMMDPIDGWQVLQLLEQASALPDHIYILSSTLKVTDIEYASNLPHVDSFIKKPLNKDRLERIQFALL